MGVALPICVAKIPFSENPILPAAGDVNFGIPLPSFPYIPISIFCRVPVF